MNTPKAVALSCGSATSEISVEKMLWVAPRCKPNKQTPAKNEYGPLQTANTRFAPAKSTSPISNSLLGFIESASFPNG